MKAHGVARQQPMHGYRCVCGKVFRHVHYEHPTRDAAKVRMWTRRALDAHIDGALRYPPGSNPRIKQALTMRQRGWSLRQIGDALGVSRERARQLVAKA